MFRFAGRTRTALIGCSSPPAGCPGWSKVTWVNPVPVPAGPSCRFQQRPSRCLLRGGGPLLVSDGAESGAAPGVVHQFGPDLDGIDAGGGLHCNDIRDVTLSECEPETGDLAVAGVSADQRWPVSPGSEFIEHSQCELPLRAVAHALGNLGLTASSSDGLDLLAGLGAGVDPGFGYEEPPVQRTRGGVGSRVHRHSDLAIAGLTRRARVLAGALPAGDTNPS